MFQPLQEDGAPVPLSFFVASFAATLPVSESKRRDPAMTTLRSSQRVPALAVLLASILFAFAVHAQEAPPERDDRTTILFRIGMTALEQASRRRTGSDDARRDLYDKAIAAFRLILVNRPELIRVRLELARTFSS